MSARRQGGRYPSLDRIVRHGDVQAHPVALCTWDLQLLEPHRRQPHRWFLQRVDGELQRLHRADTGGAGNTAAMRCALSMSSSATRPVLQ